MIVMSRFIYKSYTVLLLRWYYMYLVYLIIRIYLCFRFIYNIHQRVIVSNLYNSASRLDVFFTVLLVLIIHKGLTYIFGLRELFVFDRGLEWSYKGCIYQYGILSNPFLSLLYDLFCCPLMFLKKNLPNVYCNRIFLWYSLYTKL